MNHQRESEQARNVEMVFREGSHSLWCGTRRVAIGSNGERVCSDSKLKRRIHATPHGLSLR